MNTKDSDLKILANHIKDNELLEMSEKWSKEQIYEGCMSDEDVVRNYNQLVEENLAVELDIDNLPEEELLVSDNSFNLFKDIQKSELANTVDSSVAKIMDITRKQHFDILLNYDKYDRRHTKLLKQKSLKENNERVRTL